MSINLNLLMTFYTVAKHNSITLAADELLVSKSVVSKQLKKLEADLQCTLLQRTTRRMSLTDEGKYLFDSYANIFSQINQCHDVIDRKNDTLSGLLKIRLPSVLEHDSRLMQAVSRFMSLHNGIELEISYGYSLDDMISDSVDLAFHIGELTDSSMRARRIKSMGTRVVASPTYIEQNGSPSSPRDLAQHRCMNYRSCLTKDKWKFSQRDEDFEFVDIKSSIRSDSESLLVEMACQNIGIACALDFVCQSQLQSGTLVSLLEDYTWETELHIVYPSHSVTPYKVRKFIDHILSYYA